jgi:hydroxyacylglutathione hydrolase
MFVRLFEEGLAQTSFVIGCERTKQAVVIDPRRDVSVYVAAARQHRARITHAIETHVHADFVSGARELAATGARVVTGPGSGVAFEHEEAHDGSTMQVGDLSLTFLHTPGHTPEHISILAVYPGQPARVFTGDLLFVGAVGRPDLLGDAQARKLARQLHHSIARIMSLADDVEVHPGHGAGSLCGAGIGRDPSSTIARERRQNPLVQYADEDAFVSAVLGDLPETPPYFARMKHVNTQGPAVLGLIDHRPQPPFIRPSAGAALVADGALLLDLRDPDAFGAGHPEGAINIPYGTKVGYWAGWVVPADNPVVLLANHHAETEEAGMQLLRVGIDRIEGTINGAFEGWCAASLPTSAIDQIEAAELRGAMRRHEGMYVLDVRSEREWRDGHIDGAVNIPAGALTTRAAEVPRNATVVVVCEGGYRSSLAASLLAREGVRPSNLAGGMSAYRALEGL